MGGWAHLTQTAYDKAAAIAGSLGSEVIRSLVVCRRTDHNTTLYTIITPTPLVEKVDQRLVEMYQRAGEAEVELNDYRTHISRRYPIGEIAGHGITYLLDADTSVDPPARGTRLVLIPGIAIEQTTHSWQLTLREDFD